MPEYIPIKKQELHSLEGAAEIINWFGSWPSFHDSYLLELHLSTLERSFIKLHVYTYSEEAPNKAIVTIWLGTILYNEVQGLADQLLALTIYKKQDRVRLVIEGALALNAVLETDVLRFDLCLWPPESYSKFSKNQSRLKAQL